MDKISRASLRWEHGPETNDQGYWDDSCLQNWMKICPKMNASDGQETTSFSFGEISHPNLLVLIALLARELHKIIAHLTKDDSVVLNHPADTTLSISVAIAIPEGIFLPLCVAATHVLDDSDLSVAMVPIDPGEGMERLRRILDDCRPLLVLVAADCDYRTMHELTVQQEHKNLRASELYHVFPSSQPLFLASRSHVVDCRTVVNDIALEGDVQERLANLAANQHLCGSRVEWKLRARVRSYEKHIIGRAERSCSRQQLARNCISHIVYTSGTTGVPKGCIASRNALDAYLEAKNKMHGVTAEAVVLLASAVSFDPCISDILATITAGATLFLTSREGLSVRLHETLIKGRVSHVLCTPTLWSTLAVHDANPVKFPYLRVVALGGEQIPKQTMQIWARRNATDNQPCRLYATYGVTEACVYQTMGEVFLDLESHVGVPFEGMEVVILDQKSPDGAPVSKQSEETGEIALHGKQIDEYSAYLKQRDLTQRKFQSETNRSRRLYRTGDLGFVDKCTSQLRVLGRIAGQEGMVKYNGIRIELGEIESAIIDDNCGRPPIIADCIVILKEDDYLQGAPSSKGFHAYVVPHKRCLQELEIIEKIPDTGVLCSGDLLVLLVARCKRKARVTPTAFVLIPRIPLSRTGKRDKSVAPMLEYAVPLSSFSNDISNEEQVLLTHYCSPLGALVSRQIVDCLNLLPCQLEMLSCSATFAMLGGDSLTATRVVRALYSHHYNIFNGREVGGAYGVLDDEIFSVHHLLRANSLGEYVDFLYRNHACCQQIESANTERPSSRTNVPILHQDNQFSKHGGSQLYDALVRAITRNKILLALALVDAGAPPNLQDDRKRQYRISNTRGLQERKTIFHSTPLHLSCLKGQPKLVQALLAKRAKLNVPDAAGMFPLHLAVAESMHGNDDYNEEEDYRRLECVRLLLEAGAPLPMKDGNKQTLIHCAARSGCNHALEFALKRWCNDFIASDPIKRKGSLDWRDRWSRTPVHWAVINGKVDALRILLNHGCSSTPLKPKKNAQTSAALETPQQMCDRIYGDTLKGNDISKLLHEARN